MKGLIVYLQYLVTVIEGQPEKSPFQLGYLAAIKNRLQSLEKEES